MNILRNITAIVAGVLIGSSVNMALVIFGPMLIPPPAGVDVTSMESLAASIHLFESVHFLFPFLAHSLGTLTGALIAYSVSVNAKVILAYAIGCIFLLGGIVNTFMIPAPLWFITIDLVFAYIPMATVAIYLLKKLSTSLHSDAQSSV